MGWILDLRSEAVGGSVAPQPHVWLDARLQPSAGGLTAAAVGRDVWLVTHGFNVDRAHGMADLTAWEPLVTAALSGVEDGILYVGVLWPGDSVVGPACYPWMKGNAEAAGRKLADWVGRNLAGARSVSLVSHSLGARVMLTCAGALGRRVRRAVLMAAAVADFSLQGEFRRASANIDRLSLLASRADTVLSTWFPVGNLVQELIGLDHPGLERALGRQGPRGPGPSSLERGWQVPDGWKFDHGDYLGPGQGKNPWPPVNLPLAGPPGPTPDKRAWSASFSSVRLDEGL